VAFHLPQVDLEMGASNALEGEQVVAGAEGEPAVQIALVGSPGFGRLEASDEAPAHCTASSQAGSASLETASVDSVDMIASLPRLREDDPTPRESPPPTAVAVLNGGYRSGPTAALHSLRR
jgi:hypothetical protein